MPPLAVAVLEGLEVAPAPHQLVLQLEDAAVGLGDAGVQVLQTPLSLSGHGLVDRERRRKDPLAEGAIVSVTEGTIGVRLLPVRES